jgi:predicted DNA-binding protein with PD1-like motif
MKTFRGGTAAELIPFRLDDGEDLVQTFVRMAKELNLGSAVAVMGSGALSIVRLVPVGSVGPNPLGIITEHEGPASLISMHGWVLANQPELHLVLSHRAGLIAGRAMVGCRVHGHLEGLLLRLGNLRLTRVTDPQSGDWSLAAGARPEELPKLQLQGQAIDLQAVLKVPLQLLTRHRVLPIAISGDTLIVATANPHNVFAQDELRLATGMRIQWVNTPNDALEAALQEVLKHLR